MTERVRTARRNVWPVLLVVAFLVMAWFTWAAVRDLQRDNVILTQQVRELGGIPKVSPAPNPSPASTPSPGASGRSGTDGKDGRTPNDAEISAAVARYVREHPPKAGRAPTMAEILTAVTGYLAANPPAAGPSGAPGKDGKNGADGANGSDGADGATGPPSTDEQVRAVVAAYLESHPLYCVPPDPPGQVTGGAFRCTVNPPEG